MFGDVRGNPFNKEIMLPTLKCFANAVSNIMTDIEKFVTGHNLRVTRAQYLASLGLELARIQMFVDMGVQTDTALPCSCSPEQDDCKHPRITIAKSGGPQACSVRPEALPANAVDSMKGNIE